MVYHPYWEEGNELQDGIMDKFTFKRSWYEAVKDLPEGIRKDIYDCIVRYAFGEDVPELRSMARVAFQFIKGDMDSSKKFRALVNKRWNSYDTKDDSRIIRTEYGSNAENEESPKEKVTQKEIPEEVKEKEKDIDKSISKKKIEDDSPELFVSAEEEEKRKVAPKEKRFVKPTVAEVTEYCRERNNHINPEEFVDFYESKGWMVGSNHMKDWRAAIRTWEKNERQRTSYTPKPNSKFVDLPTDYTRPQPGFHI